MIKKEMTDGLSLLFWLLPPAPPREGEAVRECVVENIDKPQTLRLLTSQQST